MRNGEGFARRSGAVSVCTALAVLSGFALDLLLIAQFGIGLETDAFFAAYTIPLVLIICAAALQPALVSLLAAELPPRGKRAEQVVGDKPGHLCATADVLPDNGLFSALLNATGLLALALAGFGVLAAGPILGLTAPGFSASTLMLAVPLARVLFLRVPGAAVAEVLKAGLYTQRRFIAPTLSNAIPSLTAILLLLLAANQHIEVVAVGLVLGTLAQVILLSVLLFGQRPLPYRWQLRSFRSELPALRRVGGLVLAPLAGLLLRQTITLAERILGSFLPTGSVTALSYANRLTMVAAGVFFDGLTTASMPSLTAAWAQGAVDDVRAILRRLLGLTSLVALPLGLALAALSAPLVRLLFERGQVDLYSAQLLATVLGIYALSLPFLGPYRAVQTFFYAAREPRPVIVLHGILATLTVTLDLVLVRSLGAAGLAAAYVFSCGVTLAVALVWLARRAGESLDWRQLADSAWRLGLTSIAAAAVLFWSSRVLDTAVIGLGRWSQIAVVGISGLAGLVVFVGVGTILRLEAVVGVWRLARRGCNRRDSAPERLTHH